MKVLVIDDSRVLRKILGKMLVELGHKVSEAENGKIGLEAVQASADIDLVLVDWNMPEMNGLEFIERLRANPNQKSLPVMMVTTETELTNVQKALDAGANDFVMKPFTKDMIASKLTSLGI